MFSKTILVRAAALVLAGFFAVGCGSSKKSETSSYEDSSKKSQKRTEIPIPGKPGPPPISETPSSQSVSEPGAQPATQAIPEEVTLYAYPEKPLRVEPKRSGDGILSTVDGMLIVDDVEPASVRALKLGRAEKIVIAQPELGRCELTVSQFRDPSADGKIGFTLMALDESTEASTGCLAKLSTLTMTGFVVEFRRVPVSQLSDERIPLVTLKVSLQKNESE